MTQPVLAKQSFMIAILAGVQALMPAVVAVASLYPEITLAGSEGLRNTGTRYLANWSSNFYAFGPKISLPIFQGGALYHRQKAAEASLDQAKAQYRGTVLSAFQNVADALEALDVDSAALAAAARAETAAKATFDITRRQQETGQVTGLAVMQAEETYQQALITRIQAQAARYADTVGLYQALGGGWWNRKPL